MVTGYIWRYAKTQNATIFFRGIRTWSADGHDERQLQILNSWGPLLLGPLVWPLRTIFLEGDPKYRHVSSTLTRQLCARIRQRRLHEDKLLLHAELEELAKLVPEWVMEKVVDAYGKWNRLDEWSFVPCWAGGNNNEFADNTPHTIMFQFDPSWLLSRVNKFRLIPHSTPSGPYVLPEQIIQPKEATLFYEMYRLQ